MAFKRRVRVLTEELKRKDIVILKDQYYQVIEVRTDGQVAVMKDGRTHVGRQTLWTVLVDSEPVDTSNHLTVQEYLLGCGIEPERLQTAAKTFGSVLSAQFRKRHGKDAARVRKLEYVSYLDTHDGDGSLDGVPRIRENGWYESLAYAPEDRDLMDEVRAARLPALGPYRTPEERAVEVLQAHGLTNGQIGAGVNLEGPERLLWLAEEQMRRCAASGQVCGHEACSRLRSRQGGARWRDAEERAEGDMFG